MEVSLKNDGSRVVPAPEADPVSPTICAIEN